MKKRIIIVSLFTFSLFLLILPNINPIYAGWKNDDVGDASKPYLDITKLTIYKTSLQITLNENPYFNDSGANTWRFYNIWIDTSMHDTNPDTTTWSTDVYEYIAHFDCRWNGNQWINNSYINAVRYYLTSDGSAKVEGSFYWNGNNWLETDPNIDVAVISGNNIIFDVDGAIYREHPLGTGYVIQGVANTATPSIDDIAPNYGWVDEFDNECVSPTGTETPISTIGFLSGLIVLGFASYKFRIYRKRK